MPERAQHLNSELAKILRQKYYAPPDNNEERLRGNICDILKTASNQRDSTISFLREMANLIHRKFEFREVDFGLLDRSDNLYRYIVTLGHTKDAGMARLKMAYTYQDMWDEENYPAIKIGSQIWFLTETIKMEDRELYGRPSLLGKERPSSDDMIEGDYINIFMHGDRNELIGWLELENG